MLKLFIFLITINFSSQILADWQRDDLNLYVSLSNQSSKVTKDQNLNATIQNVDLTLEKTALGEGFGVAFGSVLSPSQYTIKNEKTAKNLNYSLTSNAILFFSNNSELTSDLSQSEELTNTSEDLVNILNINDVTVIETNKNIGLNYLIGKDKSTFYTSVGYSFEQLESEEYATGVFVQRGDVNQFELGSYWRQTEDTLWGVRVESEQAKRKIFLVENNYDVSNYYVSSILSFLKNSQLTTNLGVTESQSDSAFSWHLIHKTYVSDYFNFELSTSRKFDVSLENNASEELSTSVGVAIYYSPVDYVKMNLNYEKDDRERSGNKLISAEKLKLSASIDYQDTWLLTTALHSEEIFHSLTSQLISQNKIELRITKTII